MLARWVHGHERATACVALTFCLAVTFVPGLAAYSWPLRGIATALAAHCIKKRCWVGVAVFVVLFPPSAYISARQAFLSEVSPSPLRALPVVDGRVVLGGDRLRVHSGEVCFEVAACFWIPEHNWCVAAAHPCQTLPGSELKASFTLDR